MHDDDRDKAKKLATEFYRRDVDALASQVADALDSQRKLLASLAEGLWDDKQNEAPYNAACLEIGALIRDEKPKFAVSAASEARREAIVDAAGDVLRGVVPVTVELGSL